MESIKGSKENYLVDEYNRRVRTVRISVTDACNLRCSYCFTEDIEFMPTSSILSFKDIMQFLHICVDYNITKVRITGGEPFVRAGLVPFLQELTQALPMLDIRITTNGVLLEKYLPVLYTSGIRHLNISLDTLIPERFYSITGKDVFHKVYSSIMAGIEQGFSIKINTVAMKGINSDEVPQFVALAVNNPISIRFIEYMPIGATTALSDDTVWSATEILEEVQRIVELQSNTVSIASGPAKIYTIIGGKGTIGVITPLSNHFCDDCDRLRLRADGSIRTCLYSTEEVTIRDALRSSNPHVQVSNLLQEAIRNKPRGVEILDARNGKTVAGIHMSAIGG